MGRPLAPIGATMAIIALLVSPIVAGDVPIGEECYGQSGACIAHATCHRLCHGTEQTFCLYQLSHGSQCDSTCGADCASGLTCSNNRCCPAPPQCQNTCKYGFQLAPTGCQEDCQCQLSPCVGHVCAPGHTCEVWTRDKGHSFVPICSKYKVSSTTTTTTTTTTSTVKSLGQRVKETNQCALAAVEYMNQDETQSQKALLGEVSIYYASNLGQDVVDYDIYFVAGRSVCSRTSTLNTLRACKLLPAQTFVYFARVRYQHGKPHIVYTPKVAQTTATTKRLMEEFMRDHPEYFLGAESNTVSNEESSSKDKKKRLLSYALIPLGIVTILALIAAGAAMVYHKRRSQSVDVMHISHHYNHDGQMLAVPSQTRLHLYDDQQPPDEDGPLHDYPFSIA